MNMTTTTMPNEDAIATRAEEILDTETHQDVCACRTYPENCATYGQSIPWSHTDAGRWTRAVLTAQAELQGAPAGK